MSDPKAKLTKQIKRIKRAYDLLREAAQLMQWGIVKLDDNVYIVGNKATALYAKEIIDEVLRPETTKVNATGSLELGAISPNDSETPHVREPLQAEGTSGVQPELESKS